MSGDLRGLPALKAWLDMQVSFLSDDPDRKGCLIANTIMEREAHSAETTQFAQDRLEEIHAYFQQQIAYGQADGSIPCELAPDAAADGLVGTVMGLMAMARGRAAGETLQRIAAVALGSLRAG
jgi:TetR/AcrR family transcriptional repressor of nem operon